MNLRTLVMALVIWFLIPLGFTFAANIVTQGSGMADVTYDGEPDQYTLQIGFDRDTDFSNPKNAIALFSKSKFEGSANPRRIKLRVDSTKTGKIKANAENKRLVFIQDGGQLHFPKTPCVIDIQKPYSGNASSLFKGQVESCVVVSGGVEHTISAQFEVQGTPKWKSKPMY